ncbi:MAG: hypothetical protein AB7I04_08445 [Pseudomonadales bacterium]
MNRFGAFAVHLGISLIIFVILGYLILFHWYPDFFFASDGGWQGIRIVAFVDLVLGPVLTLVVFNQNKPRKELQRDLGIIAAIQLSCLTAGTYVVYSERPIAMVYADGSFQSMTIDDYQQVNQPVPEFGDKDGNPPYWVTVHLPEDLEAQSKIRQRFLQKQQPLKTASEYYTPFSVSDIDTLREGITREQMERIGMEVFERFLEEHGGNLDDYAFLRFGTRYQPALLALRPVTGELFYLSLPLPGGHAPRLFSINGGHRCSLN